MESPPLAVVLCTHQPRADFLARTLESLRAQTLPTSAWELLLVDNASQPPLFAGLDLQWHPRGRVVAEPALGLVHARLRGFAETGSALILFVDDDNVLAPDFLAQCLEIAARDPELGCWGGSLVGEFAEESPAWIEQWLPFLGVKSVAQILRSRDFANAEEAPPGAGSCYRREVLALYRERIATDSRRRALGLWGRQRLSGEDLDMALCAIDAGLEWARLPELQLVHLMSAERTSEDYLVKLVQSSTAGSEIVRGLRGLPAREPALPGLRWAWAWLRAWRLPARTRRFYLAELRGRRHAAQLIRQWETAAS